MDTATGLISHVQTDFADSRDSVHLPRLVAQLQTRLTAQQLPLREVLADAGYSNGFNYVFLEQRGITPWIPVFGKYKPVVEGFTYEPDVNAYRCPAGKLLPFRNYCTSQDGNWLKNYRAEYRDCQSCPRKPTCVPSATQKKLVRSPYDAAYLRAWQRQQSRGGQRQRRVRQGTVEPVFGNLLHRYGLRRVNTKGQAAAYKEMVLSAVAYNLKKLLKYQPTRVRSVALACPVDHQQLLQGAFFELFGRWPAPPPPGKASARGTVLAPLCFDKARTAPWLSVTESLRLKQATGKGFS